MLRHAGRSLPWGTLLVTGALLVGLMQVVGRWPYTMWPLEGCAVGLLAAVSALCFDEPAAAVVDTVARPLAWRTAARATGLLLLTGCWSVAVLLAREGLFGHSGDVFGQGLVAALAAVAYVSWRRSHGSASPGRSTAAAVVPVAAFLALARPFEHQLPIFPYTSVGDWTESRVWWTVLGFSACTVLIAVMSERGWRTRAAGTGLGAARSSVPAGTLGR